MSTNPDVAELWQAAMSLGDLERESAEEWVRLVNTGVNGFEASRRIAAEYAGRLRMAEARYEIAVATYRRN